VWVFLSIVHSHATVVLGAPARARARSGCA
jgi:hypothetical protein